MATARNTVLHCFTESPAKALARKNFKKTKIMVGTNENEGYYFLIYFLTDIFKKQASMVAPHTRCDKV